MEGIAQRTSFEVCIVVPKREKAGGGECVELLVRELRKAGLVVERVDGASNEFIKVASCLETFGRTASVLGMKKLTYLGITLKFEWEEADAFVKQPDGSLFSWTERYQCYHHLLYGIVNSTESHIKLKISEKDFVWKRHESLLRRMEHEGIVCEVFPLHDEVKRKQLLATWALKLFDFTWQPIDEICSYFGTKIATYFSFLGMYTQWMIFPALLGLAVQIINFRSWQFLIPPIFVMCLMSWSALFFQFWKRENAFLLARWGDKSLDVLGDDRIFKKESSALSLAGKNLAPDKLIQDEKPMLQREWPAHLLRIWNNMIAMLLILCLQLPFELAYAHLFEMTTYTIVKYILTAIYLLAIQYYTRFGSKFASFLIKLEQNEKRESRADSMIYKVFGLYFMQSYIGIFYHIFLHRDFASLQQILIQRLTLSQVLQHFIQNAIPYTKYTYKKHKATLREMHEKRAIVKPHKVTSRVEKEYLKTSYSASICPEFKDGTFDDFLELTLQFGMVMMFACAFPMAFCFSLLGNVAEIRADAVKLIVIMRRPIPQAAATIGAWWNIFQFLILASICTNCLLLLCFYDQERKWRLDPGLAMILIIEHVLLLIKFGLSHFVPQEPAWVKAKREQNVAAAEGICSKQLLRSIGGRSNG